MADLVKTVLDGCFLAKRITELLPPLPRGMKPRHIHVIETVHALGSEAGGGVRVGEISRALRVTAPSVTKLVGELCAMGALQKRWDAADRRAAYVELTPLGMAYYREHVEAFQAKLAADFAAIGEADCRRMAATIHRVYDCMRKRLAEETVE